MEGLIFLPIILRTNEGVSRWLRANCRGGAGLIKEGKYGRDRPVLSVPEQKKEQVQDESIKQGI